MTDQPEEYGDQDAEPTQNAPEKERPGAGPLQRETDVPGDSDADSEHSEGEHIGPPE
jgi:hypothetical protein